MNVVQTARVMKKNGTTALDTAIMPRRMGVANLSGKRYRSRRGNSRGQGE